MRLLHVIDTLKWGGAQKMQLVMARALQPLHIDLTIISLSRKVHPDLVAQIEACGAQVSVCNFPRLFSPADFGKLLARLRREKFDLLHAHLTYANILGATAGRLMGIPTIASLRSTGSSVEGEKPSRGRRFLETLALRYAATRVMANGYSVAAAHQPRLGRRLIDVLPNAVELIPPLPEEQRREVRAEISAGESQRPLILAVGRLSAAKGYPDLIAAFASLHQTHPQALLVIAGGGALEASLRAQVQSLGLEQDVRLLGVRSDVSRLLAASDLYVSSSHWEGMPNAVLEALAAGLPVVATRVGDTPYILTPGTGLAVEPRQPAALAEGLRRLLDDPALRHELGRQARQRIAHSYSPQAWVVELLRLYTQLTPAARPYLEQAQASALAEETQ